MLDGLHAGCSVPELNESARRLIASVSKRRLTGEELTDLPARFAQAVTDYGLRGLCSVAFEVSTMPLVCQNLLTGELHETVREAISDAELRWLREMRKRFLAAGRVGDWQRGYLAERFRLRGRELSIIKGYAFVFHGYGSTWLRPQLDIDIVVPTEDVLPIHRMLMADGFVPELSGEEYSGEVDIVRMMSHRTHLCIYRNHQRGMVIEMHGAPTGNVGADEDLRIPLRAVHRSRVWASRNVSVPCLVDTFLIAVAHVAHHFPECAANLDGNGRSRFIHLVDAHTLYWRLVKRELLGDAVERARMLGLRALCGRVIQGLAQLFDDSQMLEYSAQWRVRGYGTIMRSWRGSRYDMCCAAM